MGYLKDISNGLLDIIYQPFCVICETVCDDYLCDKCLEKIEIITPPYCHRCGIPCETYLCTSCREREFYFDRAVSAGIFDGVLREAIHKFKFKSIETLIEPLGNILVNYYISTGFNKRIDLVIAVPIHKSRCIERGFNQAEKLSNYLSRHYYIPSCNDALVKIKKTSDQADLQLDERMINLQDVFYAKNKTVISGKRILLIDDVFTTGSTVNEASKALKEAGAKEVYVYTLARSL